MSLPRRAATLLPRRPDYSRWTYEELRQFALQLRVQDARAKSRRELMELFDGELFDGTGRR
ncbi:MAG TPA: hypothetical protein VE907_21145 [Gammaproteobacteria bacterium]|nr:hypothetical protein [Gammaproteobacteria bacterium]